MTSEKYVFGVDFGTLSARAVLVNIKTGLCVATQVKSYAHGVLDQFLPDGKTEIPPDWALQDPHDYIDCLKTIFTGCLESAGVSAGDVVGVGTDFTTSTIVLCKADGTPLCHLHEFANNPHAYVKLWKHHGARKEASLMNRIAKERQEEFLKRYGGKISCEWMFPKVLELIRQAPEVYEAADRIMEATDWITLILTGNDKRNSCTAGWKALWQKDLGFPSKDFFAALDPRMANVINDKMSHDIVPIGTRAGYINESAAKLTGLTVGTPVSVGCGDAHAAVPGAGITKPGTMLLVIGTSGVDMTLSEKGDPITGFCGVCADGLIPGYFGFEAGQSCMGDHFQWFADNCASKECVSAAKKKGIDVLQYLNNKASKIKPGETGLIALDWWNGNRSVLVDTNLSGMIIGMTLATTSIEIYRALVEAVAFGQRMIFETFMKYGTEINNVIAGGGIAEKSPFIMQTLADVLNLPIKISAAKNTTAMGSAVMGAVAAGVENGGYNTLSEAAEAFNAGVKHVYYPNKENTAIYDALYKEYERLHDYFGKHNHVMKNLRRIRDSARH